RSERLQHDEERRGGGGSTGMRANGRRIPSLLSACEWSTHWQVSERRSVTRIEPRKRLVRPQSFHAGKSRTCRSPDRIRGIARTLTARTGLLLARRAAGDIERYCRRQDYRSGARE